MLGAILNIIYPCLKSSTRVCTLAEKRMKPLHEPLEFIR